MKKIASLITVFLSLNAFSQLYITGSSNYIYAKGEVMYVKQDINLQTGTNFYLRNEAQLVQGTTSTSANKGDGKVSVFQEGTVNNYAFNFWCSPVGNASSTTGNEGFGITMLGRPTTAIATTAAATTGSYNGISNPLTISTSWIYKFLSSANYSDWVAVGTASTINAGEGFTMKGTSGTDNVIVEGNTVQNNPGSAQRYNFSGKPNDGNITVNVAAGKFTLTGNPYPSALHVNAFLLDAANSAAQATAYYWEQDKTVNSHVLTSYKGGYGTYVPVSLVSAGVYTPATFNTYNGDGSINTTGSTSSTNASIQRKYAPIGQGFMIKGTTTGTITIKNSHRVYYKESTTANSYFAKSGNVTSTSDAEPPAAVPHIRINVSFNNEFTRQLALILIPEATDGVDNGIDGLSPNEETLPADIYFYLDDHRYVIEGVAFDVTKRIPLGIKATADTGFNFSILETVNFNESQDVYIYDRLDGTYHNIKQGNYEVALTAGTYNDRFEITFQNSPLGITEPIADSVFVVQNNNSKMLIISNPAALDLKTVTLYDISGRQIFSKQDLEAQPSYQYPTSHLSDGVYIVSIVTKDNQAFTKKVVISNHN